MNRQTVSIAGLHGGVALDAEEANALADFFEEMLRIMPAAYTAQQLRGRAKFRQIVDVLRGEAPGGKINLGG